jgi:hypothetical protein
MKSRHSASNLQITVSGVITSVLHTLFKQITHSDNRKKRKRMMKRATFGHKRETSDGLKNIRAAPLRTPTVESCSSFDAPAI